jgi:hypothetical protein
MELGMTTEKDRRIAYLEETLAATVRLYSETADKADAAGRRIAELERERDTAQANYQFMVERAANEKLDGYRELGQRCADAMTRAESAERRLAEAEQLTREYTQPTVQYHDSVYAQASPRPAGTALEVARERAMPESGFAECVDTKLDPVAPEAVCWGHYGLPPRDPCGWSGRRDELIDECCPMCGAGYIGARQETPTEPDVRAQRDRLSRECNQLRSDLDRANQAALSAGAAHAAAESKAAALVVELSEARAEIEKTRAVVEAAAQHIFTGSFEAKLEFEEAYRALQREGGG